MPARQKSVKETRATYNTKRKQTKKAKSSKVAITWAEIDATSQPIVLKRDDEPVAVVVKYRDFQRLTTAQAEHRQALWNELDSLLAAVHARTQQFTTEEIETDITAV